MFWVVLGTMIYALYLYAPHTAVDPLKATSYLKVSLFYTRCLGEMPLHDSPTMYIVTRYPVVYNNQSNLDQEYPARLSFLYQNKEYRLVRNLLHHFHLERY